MQIILGDSDAAIAFKNAVERLADKNSSRLLLAVSGGPDSLAMLLLAHATMSDRIAAVTVDHGLRRAAVSEAAFVARLCAERNISHHILTLDEPITGNIQSVARMKRYALLENAADQLQCDLIATGHHSDDQLETLLMRLARGSGIDGFAGIRARNGRIIRPLLSFTKAELEQICTDAAIKPVRDPSNNDIDFDRVAMRKFLDAREHPFDAVRATKTASALADAAKALDWMTVHLATERIECEDSNVSIDASGLPRELQRRLLLAGLRIIEPNLKPRGEAIERLLHDLHCGRTTTIGTILCQGADRWAFSPAPPRRTA